MSIHPELKLSERGLKGGRGGEGGKGVEAVPNFPTSNQLLKGLFARQYAPRPFPLTLSQVFILLFLLAPLQGPDGPHRAAARRGSAGDKNGHVTHGVGELEGIG